MASLNELQGALGQRRAAHLLRRASFRYTKTMVDQLAIQTSDVAVESLLALHPLQLAQPVYDDPATPVVESSYWINPPGLAYPGTEQDFTLQKRLNGWWLNEALNDPGIGHKMIFFFHQFMTTAAGTLPNEYYFDYLALLRWGALGNFKSLATKMIVDNTMLRYLNNNVNTKTNPNENFAREFLELFTIGKGPQIDTGDYTNYTEDDIVQAARVLTGFNVGYGRTQLDPETGIPRGTTSYSKHDGGPKTFSSKFQGGNTITGAVNVAGMLPEVASFVNMVFNQLETARNFCRRLYRYFIHPNISAEIETDIIEPLAVYFKSGNYEVLPVLRKLLKSEHFYDADDSDNKDEIIGGMIKSPLELSLQAISFFNIPIPSPISQNNQHYIVFYSSGMQDRILGLANLPLFMPQDVAGYPAYHQEPDYNRQWFNSSSIIARYKLPQILLTGKRQIGSSPNSSIGIKLNIAPWVRDSDITFYPSNADELVTDLLSYMLPETVDAERFDYFFNQIFLNNLPASDWTYEWQNYITTNNETEVKIALERLINYIMFSPEYQTF